jgi:hypothetical protein
LAWRPGPPSLITMTNPPDVGAHQLVRSGGRPERPGLPAPAWPHAVRLHAVRLLAVRARARARRAGAVRVRAAVLRCAAGPVDLPGPAD